MSVTLRAPHCQPASAFVTSYTCFVSAVDSWFTLLLPPPLLAPHSCTIAVELWRRRHSRRGESRLTHPPVVQLTLSLWKCFWPTFAPHTLSVALGQWRRQWGRLWNVFNSLEWVPVVCAFFTLHSLKRVSWGLLNCVSLVWGISHKHCQIALALISSLLIMKCS